MQALLEVTLPVFIVIGFGYAAVWRGLFSDAGVAGLMRFTQGFAIPCLLFRAISTLDLSASFDPGLLISFYTGSGTCFALGLLGARLLFGRPWEDAVAIGFSALFANTVLLGLPIMERAYGAGALQPNYAIIAVHAPFCYALGITAMEIARSRGGGALATARAVFGAMSADSSLEVVTGKETQDLAKEARIAYHLSVPFVCVVLVRCGKLQNPMPKGIFIPRSESYFGQVWAATGTPPPSPRCTTTTQLSSASRSSPNGSPSGSGSRRTCARARESTEAWLKG